jgi:hypothetical protein
MLAYQAIKYERSVVKNSITICAKCYMLLKQCLLNDSHIIFYLTTLSPSIIFSRAKSHDNTEPNMHYIELRQHFKLRACVKRLKLIKARRTFTVYFDFALKKFILCVNWL